MRDESEAAESERLVWIYRSRHIVSIAEIVKRVAKLKDVPYAGDASSTARRSDPSSSFRTKRCRAWPPRGRRKERGTLQMRHFREVDDLLRRGRFIDLFLHQQGLDTTTPSVLEDEIRLGLFEARRKSVGFDPLARRPHHDDRPQPGELRRKHGT
jgi:hypothetical protein